MGTKKYVAYYRVSTKKQGESGLGLEAQKQQVNQAVGGKGEIIAEFTEVESGRKDTRPELQKAIAFAKQSDAVLIIAKLDRLSRNVAFIFSLRASGVKFECADMPEANTLTIGIFATLAQYERELISQRTKAALAAKKAQGLKLGSPIGFKSGVPEMGHRKITENFLERTKTLGKIIKTLHDYEKLSFREIARRLEEMGFRSKNGKKITYTYAHKVYRSKRGEFTWGIAPY